MEDVGAREAYWSLTAGIDWFYFDLFKTDTAFLDVISEIFLLDFEERVEVCFRHIYIKGRNGWRISESGAISIVSSSISWV